MSNHRQSDFFKESDSFPISLFQAQEFEAVQYFKKWYYIFHYHIKVLEDNKDLTDKISSNIARNILEGIEVYNVEDPQKMIEERVDIEISHLIINHFYEKQLEWFKQRDYKETDIKAFLWERKQRIEKINLDEVAQDLQPKIETAIAYFELIDEKISKEIGGQLN